MKLISYLDLLCISDELISAEIQTARIFFNNLPAFINHEETEIILNNLIEVNHVIASILVMDITNKHNLLVGGTCLSLIEDYEQHLLNLELINAA